jgi:hypothetical protein
MDIIENQSARSRQNQAAQEFFCEQSCVTGDQLRFLLDESQSDVSDHAAGSSSTDITDVSLTR